MFPTLPEDFCSVFVALQKRDPNEAYLLAAQSSVGLSFEQPAETIQSISMGVLSLLEAIRMLGSRKIKFYHAGSSECSGVTQGVPATESTTFAPRSPHAVSDHTRFPVKSAVKVFFADPHSSWQR